VVSAEREVIEVTKPKVGAAVGDASPEHRPVFDSYDLIRLGYVVFGGKFVVRFDDWDVLDSVALMRMFFHLWSYRVAVWVPDEKIDPSGGDGEYDIVRRVLCNTEPKLCRLDDPKLLKVSFWDISAVDTE
jgi:hypothetical protein